MVEKRIESVKKEIRSVLICSKNGLSLDEFRKSYRNLLGMRLPSREFGFTSDLDFLYSLDDVVHVQIDRNGYHQLYGIADEDTEHIQKLVSKQRQPKVNLKKQSNYFTKNFKFNQKSLPIVTPRCRPFVPAQLRSEITKIVKQYPDGIGYMSLVQAYQNVYKKRINLEWLSSDPNEKFKKLADAIPELNLRFVNNQLKIHYLNFPTNEEKDKATSSSQHILQDLKANSSHKFKSIEHERKKKILDISAIPEDIKVNFVKVLEEYPKGILAVHFPIVFEKSTKVPLNFYDLGYSSLLELVDALPDIFVRKNVSESSKDWIILKAEFSKQISQPSGFISKVQSHDTFSPKMFPSYCLEKSVPHDIAEPSLPYVKKALPDEATEKFFPVFVSSAINPGLFWIQLQTEEATSNLAKLEEEMKSFYKNQKNTYRMTDADILIGSSCVAYSTTDFHWYRAIITSLPSIDHANVSFVDYGSWGKMHKSNLYYLKHRFINMPVHAHKSRLASIKPANQLSKWSLKAQARFLQLCNHVSIMAKIETLEEDILALFLCDTSGDEDIHINDALVNESFAECCLGNYHSNSPNAANLSLENGKELSSYNFSQKPAFCEVKSKTSEHETSNGMDLNIGIEKSKLLPKNLFVEKLEALKLSSTKRRYFKKVLLGDGYTINIIVVADEAYVSGGDLCNLFWKGKEEDVLALRLKFKGAIIPTITISEEDFEELFVQCKRYSVKGFHDIGKESSVVLYPLKYVMKVLNIFGHPSLNIREALCKEITNFNPHDMYGNEFPESDTDISDEAVVDAENALSRLCLYDLKALHEGLRFKRLKLTKDSQEDNSYVTEINKIVLMQNNILKQMDVINSICSRYES